MEPWAADGVSGGVRIVWLMLPLLAAAAPSVRATFAWPEGPTTAEGSLRRVERVDGELRLDETTEVLMVLRVEDRNSRLGVSVGDMLIGDGDDVRHGSRRRRRAR